MLSQTYQRGTDAAKVFHTRYNNYGYESSLERGGLVLWQANVQDASNRVTQASLGTALTQAKSYNSNTGRTDSGLLLTTGNAIRLQESYAYDVLGNVMQRGQFWDSVGFTESFDYDPLNRIGSSTVAGQSQQNFTYDAAGNLTSKPVAGIYTYPAQGAGAVRPHGVTTTSGLVGAFAYDDNGNLTSSPGRTLTWTSFDMPVKITKGGMSSQFVYGTEHQRLKQTVVVNNDVASLHAASVDNSGSARSGLSQTSFFNFQFLVAPDQRSGQRCFAAS